MIKTILLFFNSLNLGYFILLGATLFIMGAIGYFLRYKNIFIVILSLIIMLLGVILNFAAFSLWRHSYNGQVMAFFILLVILVQIMVSLTIYMVMIYRYKSTNR